MFGIFACIYAALMVAPTRAVTVLLLSLAAILIAGVVLIAQPRPLLPPLAKLLGPRCRRWLDKGIRVEHNIRAFAGAMRP